MRSRGFGISGESLGDCDCRGGGQNGGGDGKFRGGERVAERFGCRGGSILRNSDRARFILRHEAGHTQAEAGSVTDGCYEGQHLEVQRAFLYALIQARRKGVQQEEIGRDASHRNSRREL